LGRIESWNTENCFQNGRKISSEKRKKEKKEKYVLEERFL